MYISQYDNEIALHTVEVIECNSLLMNFITFYYIGIQYHPTYIHYDGKSLNCTLESENVE